MCLCKLTNYLIEKDASKKGLERFDFSISKGDVCSIQTDSRDDARSFLRALATLMRPVSGTYLFNDDQLDFSDYRKLLPYKKKIGYIAPSAAMLSNRTVRENLLLGRFYHEDSLAIELTESTKKFCADFNLNSKLNVHAARLDRLSSHMAVTARELAKAPDLLLLERPEDYIGHRNLNIFSESLKELLETGLSVVLFSYDKKFVARFSNRTIIISNSRIAAAED